MSSGNSWIDGDVMFTGILYGNGEDLTNLSDFGDYVFESEHFESDLLSEQHIQDDIVQLQHIYPQSIHTANVEIGNVSADYMITIRFSLNIFPQIRFKFII